MTNGATARAGGRSYLVTSEMNLAQAAFACATWTMALFAGIALTTYVWGGVTKWSLAIAVLLWTAAMVWSIPLFLVNVPEITGLIAINVLKKSTERDPYANLVVFTSGLWFKYPWHQVMRINYINLRYVTQEFNEDFPCKSGPKVHLSGSIQYAPRAELLPHHIAVDDTTIKKGLVDIITAFLSSIAAHHTAEVMRESVEELQKGLIRLFEQVRSGSLGQQGSMTFEHLYGIDVILIRLSDAGYDQRYQDVLDSQAVSGQLRQISAQYREDGLSSKDAQNAAFITNGDVPKSVVEVEGDSFQALAGILLNLGRGADLSPQHPPRRQRGTR